jgi:hypothetical protein
VKLFRAIFANSTVNLKNVSLNEEFLKVEGTDIKIELALEQEEIVKISLYVTSYRLENCFPLRNPSFNFAPSLDSAKRKSFI